MTGRLAGALALAAALFCAPSASAAVVSVGTTADELDAASPCSLREAVRSASTDAAVGGCAAGDTGTVDTIQLAAGSYGLTIPGEAEGAGATGDLDLVTAAGDVELVGASAATTTIDAGLLDRALDVTGDGALTIERLTFVDGATPGFPSAEAGGAIRWASGAGSLTVTDSVFAENTGIAGGGAIDATSASGTTILRTRIHGNDSTFATVHTAGYLRIEGSEIADNGGGGIASEGPLELIGSTVTGHDNTDTPVGGVVAGDDALIERSTIAENVGGYSGGVEANGGDLVVRFSTIANNRSPSVTTFPAAGIEAVDADSVTVDGSIISGNRVRLVEGDCNVDLAEGPNPSLASDTTCGLDAPGSIEGQDAQLAPLAGNGGPTRTMGLYPGSPAVDAALAACVPATDQRGEARPGGSPRCDMGAFEGTVPRPVDRELDQTNPGTKDAICPPAGCRRVFRCPKGFKPVARKGKAKPRCVKRKRPKKKAKGRAAAPLERIVIGRSVRGRPIQALRYGDPEGERVALAVSVIHGDERAGLGVIEAVPDQDLDGVQLWVIPSLNPDGMRSHDRRNARGVDLNRNFPFRWRGGVPKSSGYYPGPRPASEPETRAAMRFIERIGPQVSVWYHQPWGAVLACGGRPGAGARYSEVSGMRTSCRGKGLRGTAISWENEEIKGSQAFVVEFKAGAVSQANARRHALALATIARDG